MYYIFPCRRQSLASASIPVKFRSIFSFLALALLAPLAAQAQLCFTWQGITSNSTSPSNWSGGDETHLTPGGDPENPDNVFFGSVGEDGTSSVVICTDLALNNITFTDGQNYQFSTNGTPTLYLFGKVTVESEACIILGSGLTVALTDGCHTLCIAEGGNLKVEGNITDAATSGGILLKGGGTLTLSGNNTFSGGVNVKSGTLFVGSDNAVGTGTLKLHDDVQLVPSAASVTLSVPVVVTGTVENDYTENTNALTLTGVISGCGGFDWCSAGTLTLTNCGSTFCGGVDVRSGVLLVGGSSRSVEDSFTGPLGTGTVTLEDGTTLGVAPLSGPITLANQIVLGGVDPTIDTTNGNLTLTGYVTGYGALTVAGTHTLTLTGSDDYSGGTTINACATLQIGSGGTCGSIIGDVLDCGILAFNRCDSITFCGVVSGSGSVSVYGGSNSFVTLTATNTYTGGTNIFGGFVVIGNGGTNGSIVGVVTFHGTTDLGGGDLQFNRSDSTSSPYVFAGNISGSGRVSLFGGGAVTLSGANSYTGGTYIRNGTLADYSGGNFSPGSDVFIHGSSALQVNNNETVGGLEDYTEGEVTTSGTVAVASGATLTVSTNGTSLFSGVISGTGGRLAKTGTGTLSLDGANTFTGGVALNCGTLYIGNTSGLGTGTLTAASGTTFGIGGPLTLANAIVLTSGTVNLDIDGNTTLSGAISGSGILNLLSGTNGLSISNNNGSWFGGLNVAGSGPVSLAQNALGTGTLSFASGNSATVTFSGLAPSIGGLSGGSGGEPTVSLASGATLIVNQSGTSSYYGGISGSASVVKTGTGTLTLAGPSSYTGGTTITNGTLVYGANGAFGTGSVTLNGGELAFGPGTPTLSNPLIFSAPVTLSGNGTIGTLITAGSGVTLSPGNSPGTLSFSAGLVLAGGGTLTFQVQDANGSAGNGYDLLAVSGSLLNITATSGSRFTIDLTSLNGSGNAGAVSNFNSSSAYNWTFVTSSSGISGFNANDFTIDVSSFSNSLNGGTFAVTDSGSLLALQFTPGAVPEPSTWVMLAMGVVTLPLALRRRRRG